MFRVEPINQNETKGNLPYTVLNGNNTIKTGTTSETGVIVFPLKFRREYGLIENPQPGGPYLKDLNNFTSPLTLMIGAQATEFGFTSETPVRIQLASKDTQVTTTETSVPVPTGTALVIALMALGGIVYGLQKGKTPSTNQTNE